MEEGVREVNEIKEMKERKYLKGSHRNFAQN